MEWLSLGLGRGSWALSPWLLSQLVWDAASAQGGHSVRGYHLLSLPASPLALLLCLVLEGAARSQPKDQAQLGAGLGQGKGQQPCQDLSRTHHGFGVNLSVRNSETALTFVPSLLRKAGSHLNQQHIVAKAPFGRNPQKKSCGPPPWQAAVLL